jgi:hypothetical protein
VAQRRWAGRGRFSYDWVQVGSNDTVFVQRGLIRVFPDAADARLRRGGPGGHVGMDLNRHGRPWPVGSAAVVVGDGISRIERDRLIPLHKGFDGLGHGLP